MLDLIVTELGSSATDEHGKLKLRQEASCRPDETSVPMILRYLARLAQRLDTSAAQHRGREVIRPDSRVEMQRGVPLALYPCACRHRRT